MVRVLFVEASQGGVLGGSLTGLYHLIRGLRPEQCQASIVLYEPKVIEPDLARLGVPVYHVRRARLPKGSQWQDRQAYRQVQRVPPLRVSLRSGRQAARLLVEELPAAFALARVIRRSGTEVAHLGNGLRANFDALMACWLTRTPAVCHVKGFEKYGARERWASRYVRALVCMTGAVLEHCRASGVDVSRARVVYDAVDNPWLESRRPPTAVRRELGIGVADPLVGIVGNVQEWKGQAVLVEALAQVSRDLPAIQALIVGGVHRAGAEYAAALHRRVEELGVSGRVHFVGFREDVADVVSALDVLVHASIRPEPFGRVILEGMLLGKPVIATAAGGVLELIEDGRTGFLVPPGDAKALASCLRQVLADSEGSRVVGARARAWAEKTFLLSRQAESMRAIYEEAVRKNGSS